MGFPWPLAIDEELAREEWLECAAPEQEDGTASSFTSDAEEEEVAAHQPAARREPVTAELSDEWLVQVGE
eukprot:549928-Alexandrium_andersonii.AAC.1